VLCVYATKMSTPNVTLVSSAAVDGLPPVTDAKSGMAAVLHILMNHMADCLHLVLDSVVEKYGLNKEEVMRVITENPRWKELPVNPLIHDLGYVLPSVAAAPAEPVLPGSELAAAEPAAAAAAPPVNVCPDIEDTAKLMKEIDEVLEGSPAPAAAAAAPAAQPKKRVSIVKKVKKEAPAAVLPPPPPAAEAEVLVLEAPPLLKEELATATPPAELPAPPPAPPAKKKVTVTRVKKMEAAKPASP
jgi:hypothetical protein